MRVCSINDEVVGMDSNRDENILNLVGVNFDGYLV